MLRLNVLGTLSLHEDGNPERNALQPKRAALLAYLLVAKHRPRHQRDTLLALFWPDLDDTRARKALNQALHYLRQELGPDAVTSVGDDQIVVDMSRLWCDAVAFEDLLNAGDVEKALALYRGDFMEGFFVSDVGGFERWLDEERARLRSRAIGAAWTLAEQAATTDSDAALRWAQYAAQMEPEADERALRRLITLHDRVGDRAGAVRLYEDFAQKLDDEYGAKPSPETRALILAIHRRAESHSDLPADMPDNTASAQPSTSVQRPASAIDTADRAPAVTPRIATRSRVALAALIVGIIAAISLWSALRPDAPAGSVAIFPFTYNGSPANAHLAAAAVTLLSANLDGTNRLRSIDQAAVSAAAGSDGTKLTRARAQALTRKLKAGAFIMGDVAEAGGRIRITATLMQPAGWSRAVHATVEGKPDELFTLIDRLTADILAGQGVSTAFDESATRTTSSLPALQRFLQGEEQYRAGNFATAAELFRQAVDEDSTFALAYFRLSNASNWTGASQLSQWAADNAMKYRNRLPIPAQRHVEAWRLYLQGHVDEAEPLYQHILRDDSSDVDAHEHLADIIYHWGPMTGRPAGDSRTLWQSVLDYEPQDNAAALHLARIAARDGDRSEFDRLAGIIAGQGSGSDQMLELRALRAFSFGTTADRQRAANDLTRLSSEVRREAVHEVAAASPDQADVASILFPIERSGQNYSSWDAGEMTLAASSMIARGEVARANRLLDSAAVLEPARVAEYRAGLALVPIVPVSRQDLIRARDGLRASAHMRGSEYPMTTFWRAYLKGVLSARAHDDAGVDEALRSLALAKKDTTRSFSLFADWFSRIIAAERLRAAGKPKEALAALGPPAIEPDYRLPRVWAHHRAHERFLRAELLNEAGRSSEALTWYATFPDPSAFDLAYLPVALSRRAAILRKIGDARRADEIEAQLSRLLDNADPAVIPR
jgi:DNA-binding SARP family transcriptional activator/TolB-like protein